MNTENESMGNKAFDHTEIPVEGYPEEAFCNCENQEQITPYESDGQETPFDADPTQPCHLQKPTCSQLWERLGRAWRATDHKPYIKKTTSCRVEIYRQPLDTEPIDSLCTEKSHSFSLRGLLLIGAATMAVIGIACCCKRK